MCVIKVSGEPTTDNNHIIYNFASLFILSPTIYAILACVVMPYLKVIVHWKLLDWIVYGIMINDMYVISTFLLTTLLEKKIL